METFNPSARKLADYIRSHGKKGETALAILAKEEQFITAINSEVGQLLMADLVAMHKDLLFKIAELNASDEDKAKYKVVREIISKWSTIMNDYEKRLQEILNIET